MGLDDETDRRIAEVMKANDLSPADWRVGTAAEFNALSASREAFQREGFIFVSRSAALNRASAAQSFNNASAAAAAATAETVAAHNAAGEIFFPKLPGSPSLATVRGYSLEARVRLGFQHPTLFNGSGQFNLILPQETTAAANLIADQVGKEIILWGTKNAVEGAAGGLFSAYLEARRAKKAIEVAQEIGRRAKASRELVKRLDDIFEAGFGEIPANAETLIYQKVGPNGEHLKFGIAKNEFKASGQLTRYTDAELGGGRTRILGGGSRSDMLNLERRLHENMPLGPQEGQKFYYKMQLENGYLQNGPTR
jgi:hypothetical protein